MPGGDDGEKTEAPTGRRRQEARDDGQIPKSADLSAAVLLLGGLIVLSFLGPRFMRGFTKIMGMSLQIDISELTASHSIRTAEIAFRTGMSFLLPVLLSLAGLAFIVTLIQVGFVLTGKPLTPNFGRLNPLSGMKKLLFTKRTAVKLAIDLAKVALIGYLAYLCVRGEMSTIVALSDLGHLQIFAVACDMIFALGIRLGLVLLVLALLDYAYQRWQHEQDLKMSKQEVREELKRMDGDPQLKGRRREIARQFATQRMATDVPRADVVVTNPTEFAVAIRYHPEDMDAPRVVAKGTDYMALQIRRIAQAHGVPIVQRKPLARALYATVDVGQEIPPKFYKVIAEILAYVYETSGKSKKIAQAM